MTKPLSLSGYNKYVTCPALFELHYNKRIRPTVQPSHLVFGSAIDAALNEMIGETGSPLQACEEVLKRLVVERVEFFKADYDGELIPEATKAVLLEKVREFGYQGDDVDQLAMGLLSKSPAELSENQRKALALCCTASLKEKAKLMLEAYKSRVMPLIKRVDSVQKEAKWTDANGASFVGVLDLVADFAGEGLTVVDNKTASRPYESNAVSVSTQLALYCQVEGIPRAAYVVLDKQIRKNRVKTCENCGNVSTGRHKTCDAIVPPIERGKPDPVIRTRCGGEWSETIKPEVNVQILTGEVNADEGRLALEALSDTARAIKGGVFPKNLNACNNQYGRPCPYRSYCRNGDMTGLELKDEGER